MRACHVFLCALMVSGLSAAPAAAQARRATEHGCRPNRAVFAVGEDLRFEVSYMGITLGTIATRVLGVDSGKGGMRYRTECVMRSAKGVPFTTINTTFRSIIGDSLQSVGFRNREYLGDTVFKTIEYTFPKNADKVVITEHIDQQPDYERVEKLPLDGKLWQDGLSLLFYARAFAQQACSKSVPVLMYYDKAETQIDFGRRREGVDIDAVSYPVRTVKIEGETGFTGIFGLTGGFEGWFSDDAAAVPIRAKMHVLVGSVTIELISWKRGGWGPPRAGS